MSLYKILVNNEKQYHTFSGSISETVNHTHTIFWTVSGEISGKISGLISGNLYGINYVANNLQEYSGVASGVLSGEIEGTITDKISGKVSETFIDTDTISGTIKDSYRVNSLAFLQDEIKEEDWSTESLGILKEELLYLYRHNPQCAYIPVHILSEEIDLKLDNCLNGELT
jgi:hypothetical protein